ncbi:hypothetical protein [Gemmatimonas sp.]|uniref:hypothetical protein n=1 Tax=Gemmatimonas sp. TaxID=1962908 RepID=UPI00356753F5
MERAKARHPLGAMRRDGPCVYGRAPKREAPLRMGKLDGELSSRFTVMLSLTLRCPRLLDPTGEAAGAVRKGFPE